MGTLTERVLRFQETGEGQAELLVLVAERVYGYPRVRGSRSEDDPGEFYLFFYPRLLRSLRRFRDQGKPFEWYLQSVLRWQYLIFVRVKRRRERQWNAGALPAFWDTPELEAPRPVPESSASSRGAVRELTGRLELNAEGRVTRPGDRTRLLAWTMKQVRSLAAEELVRLAAATGVPEAGLESACQALRQALEPRERRLERLRDRRARAYAAMCLLEQQLSRETDPALRERLTGSLQRVRRCLRRSQERIARVPREPSNRQVAAALGLPKGTVDSALFSLKKKLVEAQDSEAA